MFKSMSIHQKDSEAIVKSNFVTSCLAFRGSIPTTVPYASVVGSFMYAMLCTKLNICFVVGMVSKYQSNLGPKHWTTIKHILKYLRIMRDYMFVFQSDVLVPRRYTNLDFRFDKNFCRFISIFFFYFWRSNY